MSTTASPSQLLAAAGVPAFKCPVGARMHILNLGTHRLDEGWLIRGAGTSTASNPNPVRKQQDLIIIAALIEHPEVGLILFETGCAEDLQVQWTAPIADVFPRVEYSEKHKLPAAIKATGNDIKDIKAIIIGHLHLDHAGGLEHFIGTDVPVYVHEEEFKHACWALATGADHGVYGPDYLDLERINWQTFSDEHFEIFQGITLHHAPGHTPGLVMMQVNLEKDGTFIWTTDQFHIADNYYQSHPHGWLARDHTAWIRSLSMARRLQRLFNATLIFGHDKDVAETLIQKKKFFE